MTTSERLKYYIEKSDYTFEQLGDLTGIAKSSLQRYTSGNTKKIPIEAVEKIAACLGVSALDILGWDSGIDSKTARNASVRIPVLGRIPAGIPFDAIEDIIGYEDIPSKWVAGGKEYFALKIEGDSMSDKYLAGDVIIYQKADTCDSGEECAVMVNGEDATFKKVIRQKNGIILQPLNISKYEPRFYSNEDIANLPVRVLGIAKEIRRKA